MDGEPVGNVIDVVIFQTLGHAVVSLGDLLEEQGYKQVFLMGSDLKGQTIPKGGGIEYENFEIFPLVLLILISH